MLRSLVFFVTTFFFLSLLDIRVISRRIFHRRSVESFLNIKAPLWGHGIVNLGKLLLGFKFRNDTDHDVRDHLPAQFILLSNHQTMLDIVFIYNLFTRHQIRFVAKKSLGKGFPGASQTLRYQGHALIDQAGNARANHSIITNYAKRCKRLGYCPVIFPEGTRSRTGELGVFQTAGLRMILDQGAMPVVVLAMDGGWKMATLKDYFRSGHKEVRVKILGTLPAPTNKEETREVIATSQAMINRQLAAWRGTGV